MTNELYNSKHQKQSY